MPPWVRAREAPALGLVLKSPGIFGAKGHAHLELAELLDLTPGAQNPDVPCPLPGHVRTPALVTAGVAEHGCLQGGSAGCQEGGAEVSPQVLLRQNRGWEEKVRPAGGWRPAVPILPPAL